MEISTLLCQYVRVLLTCLTKSSPVPSRDRLIATTTMSATVIVRFRRSPTQISWNTKFERILAYLILRLSCVVRCGTCKHAVSKRDEAPLVRLAVHAAYLIADHLAVLELDDALAHRIDNSGIVGSHDDRRPGPVDPVKHLHDADRGRRVDVSRRLVGEQDHRAVDERAGHRDTLLLTAGQFVRHPVMLALEAHQVDHFRYHAADEPPRLADHLERERHVLVDILARQQPEVLEHAADPAAQVRHLPVCESRQVLPRDVDAPLGRPLLLEDQPQERRLAGPGRTHQEDELTLVDREVDVLQRSSILVRVDLGDVVKIDHGTITSISTTRDRPTRSRVAARRVFPA